MGCVLVLVVWNRQAGIWPSLSSPAFGRNVSIVFRKKQRFVVSKPIALSP
jgi:hypothetical protein